MYMLKFTLDTFTCCAGLNFYLLVLYLKRFSHPKLVIPYIFKILINMVIAGTEKAWVHVPVLATFLIHAFNFVAFIFTNSHFNCLCTFTHCVFHPGFSLPLACMKNFHSSQVV